MISNMFRINIMESKRFVCFKLTLFQIEYFSIKSVLALNVVAFIYCRWDGENRV